MENDVMKLLMSNFEVTLKNDDNIQEFYVILHGPRDTPYFGCIWKIHVELPEQYPFKSPSIGFLNKIYHPNVDEMSGTVCLDVINQLWSPMYDLVNIFDVFLPQLLRYPNPKDPLNGEAAALLLRDPSAYEQKVRDYASKYASSLPDNKVASPLEQSESEEEQRDDSVLDADPDSLLLEEDLSSIIG